MPNIVLTHKINSDLTINKSEILKTAWIYIKNGVKTCL